MRTIKKILVISLSNIGDVVLTFPVIDILNKDFPDAELSVVTGPKAGSLMERNPNFKKVHIFDKHQPWIKTLKWIIELRKDEYDLVVDLRNTAIPFLIKAKKKTPLNLKRFPLMHMRNKHLNRLRSVYEYSSESLVRYSISVNDEDRRYVQNLISKEIGDDLQYIIMAPSAADSAKRWDGDNYAAISDWLTDEFGYKVVFVGYGETDEEVCGYIGNKINSKAVNLCGRLSLLQLAELIQHAYMVIGNDSSPLHIASYLNKPAFTLFGPSNPAKYAPWSVKAKYIKKSADCPRCLDRKDPLGHTCMRVITVEDVKSTILEWVKK